MPPPPTTKVPALKQDTFHKKVTSKPSSQTNLTLAEAKAILLGKSTSNVITSGSGNRLIQVQEAEILAHQAS